MNFNEIRIIPNHMVPKGTIFVSEEDFEMFTNYEGWKEKEDKKSKDLIDFVDAILNQSTEITKGEPPK